MIRTIMDAIASALEGSPGVDQIVARWNVKPTGLSIDVYPADPDFVDEDPQGFGPVKPAYVFTVRARISGADYDGAQEALLDLMDASLAQGVANVLQDDQTLSGTASSVLVEGPSGFRRYVDVSGDAARLGVEWKVTVLPLYT